MSTTLRRVAIWGTTIVLCFAATAVAQVIEMDSLPRKLEEQRRADTLTRELLAGILDIQLRQLEENGLTDQEIFREIQLMRRNLSGLVENEMTKIVDLLFEAQQLPDAQRNAIVSEARQQIRNAVRQLSVERQGLLKRLKSVELVEQVRRLIREQTSTHDSTKRIPIEPEIRREALILKAIEDQRDVKEMFLHLVDSLNQMRSWNSVLAAAATDGLRLLKVADVSQHLDRAAESLRFVKSEPAALEQELVIKGLKELLKVIEHAQGVLDSDKMVFVEKVRVLIETQKQLRDATKKLTSNQLSPSELVERQSRIQQEIIQLQIGLFDHLKVQTHLQQAETAALDAAANLLDNKLETAIDDQGRVLGNMAAIEQAVSDQLKQPSRDISADELADAVRELTIIKAALVKNKTEREAVQKRVENPTDSSDSEANNVIEVVQRAKTIFARLGYSQTALFSTEPANSEITLFEDIPFNKLSIEEAAHEQPRKADGPIQVQRHSPDSATPPLTQVISPLRRDEKAGHVVRSISENAFERTLAAVDNALMDTQRRESAVKIGELARAAEVLERLASEEREIANEDLGESIQTALVGIAQMLSDRQAEVLAVVDKIVEATVRTANRVSIHLANGGLNLRQSSTALRQAVERESSDLKQALTNSNKTALNSSQKLRDAAKILRQEILIASKELIERTATQFSNLADVRKGVDAVIDRLPSNDKIIQLQGAKRMLGEAMQQQARAQGKPELAANLQVVKLIIAALDHQEVASSEAAFIEKGIGSELQAVIKQQEVVEITQVAIDVATPRRRTNSDTDLLMYNAITGMLSEAQRAAAESARQLLNGKRRSAAESRIVVETTLQKALLLAKQEVVSALKAQTKDAVDQSAQSRVTEAAVAVHGMTLHVSTEFGTEIELALIATRAATEAILSNSDQVSVMQTKTIEALVLADEQLDKAIHNAAMEQSTSLADRAIELRALAERVNSVEPAAADAVIAAIREATAGSIAGYSPNRIAAAVNRAEMAMAQVAADLDVKEQQIRRDLAIAESVATLVQEQQVATEIIAEQVVTLESTVEAPEENNAPTTALRTAAKKLAEAQQRFAEAQRTTGLGAVEISGQKEVANRPLREALELASNLPSSEMSTEPVHDSEHPDDLPVEKEVERKLDQRPEPLNQPTTAGTSSNQKANQRDSEGPGRTTQGTPGSGKPSTLGMGFVPHSPQLTAEMMAGSAAHKAAQKALEQQLPLGHKSDTDPSLSSEHSGDSEDGQPIPSENANSSRLTRKDGSSAINQPTKNGALDKQKEGTEAAGMASSKAREKDDGVSAKRFKEEAWFAKLPPELRKSMRAGTGQKPPRAYEERLKRYFQSVD